MHKRIIILGSTGSIGQAALEVVTALGDEVEIVGLAAGNNWRLLAEQAARFGVASVAIASENGYEALGRACPRGTNVLAGAGEAEHVFVFGHHPLHDQPVWARFRSMLNATKTTLFGGHLHRLSFAVEDGVPYLVLGPTGARAFKPDRRRGLFQSFAHVTVSDGQPSVAIIPMGEVLAHDVVPRRSPAVTAAATAPKGE